ncbi:MAG TPA: hypothetical protein VN381_11240 [Anaerovoracaceae bacterium]|nr:hypothetical protein [Anaerovoracaceae bacterium]
MRKLTAVLTVLLCMLFSTIFSHAAAGNPNVVLVNPAAGSIVYSSNLLISVKLTQPTTIKVSVFEEKQAASGTAGAVSVNTAATSGALNSVITNPIPVTTPAIFISNNNLTFYTKQVNGLKPGLYKIQIDTLDTEQKVIYTNSSHVAIKEKAEEADAKIFDDSQSGTMQFLQTLLKTIFGE